MAKLRVDLIQENRELKARVSALEAAAVSSTKNGESTIAELRAQMQIAEHARQDLEREVAAIRAAITEVLTLPEGRSDLVAAIRQIARDSSKVNELRDRLDKFEDARQAFAREMAAKYSRLEDVARRLRTSRRAWLRLALTQGWKVDFVDIADRTGEDLLSHLLADDTEIPF